MVQRSPNSHQIKKRAFPHTARLPREKPFRPADVGFTLIGFAIQAEAEAMQRWIAPSGIEKRRAPEPYRGRMLGVLAAKPS